jgi:hypothetical protein
MMAIYVVWSSADAVSHNAGGVSSNIASRRAIPAPKQKIWPLPIPNIIVI